MKLIRVSPECCDKCLSKCLEFRFKIEGCAIKGYDIDFNITQVCTEYHKNQTKITPPVPRKAVITKMPAIPEVEEQITPVVTKIGPYAIKKTGVQKLIVNPKWSLKRVEMGVQVNASHVRPECAPFLRNSFMDWTTWLQKSMPPNFRNKRDLTGLLGTGLGVLNTIDSEVLLNKLTTIGSDLVKLQQPLQSSLLALGNNHWKLTKILPEWEDTEERDHEVIINALGTASENMSLALGCTQAQLWMQSVAAAVIREGGEGIFPAEIRKIVWDNASDMERELQSWWVLVNFTYNPVTSVSNRELGQTPSLRAAQPKSFIRIPEDYSSKLGVPPWGKPTKRKYRLRYSPLPWNLESLELSVRLRRRLWGCSRAAFFFPWEQDSTETVLIRGSTMSKDCFGLFEAPVRATRSTPSRGPCGGRRYCRCGSGPAWVQAALLAWSALRSGATPYSSVLSRLAGVQASSVLHCYDEVQSGLQVTVRPRDRGQFWDEVKAKVEGLSGDAGAGARLAVSDVQLVPSRVPASDPVGSTGQDRAGAAASSEGLQAFPVLQGATHNTYQPLAWQALSELRDEVGKYALGPAEVIQVLRYFNASLLTPFDIRSLAQALFPPVEYDFFENRCTQLSVRAVERNTTLGPGDPRRMVNIDMLMGTGNYTRAEGQAGYEPLVQEQCQQTGMAALVQTLQLATPQQPFATIVQGIDEPFLCFAGRLTAAVEKQVSDPAARKLMTQSVAQGNCNAACKRIIEALPGEPSMSDMVGACAKISPSSQQVLAVPTAVQPAVSMIVQVTVTKAVQLAVPAAVQPAVAAAVQPAWVVPQGVQQQQWGARARKKQSAESVVIDSDKIHKVPLDAFGPLGDGMSAFLMGRSSATIQGIIVHLGLIDADFSGQIHAMVSTPTPPLTIPKGTQIAQLVPFKSSVSMTEDRSWGDGGFGSTGPPQVRWTAVLTKDCPETLCTMSMVGATPSESHLRGLLDTGADEQLDQGHLEPSTSPWNTPVFCIKKKSGKWRLLQDLRKINAVMEGMGTLQAARALSGVRKWFPDAHVYHYMDDILVATPTQEELLRMQPTLLNALHSHGLQVAPEKVQQQPPYKYLGVKILERTIRHQEVQFVQSVKTLNDAQKLVGVITWLRPYLGLTTAQLSPLFELLKRDTDLKSSRELTPEARKVLEEVQQAVSACQVYRIEPSIDVTVFITTPDLHPTGEKARDVIAHWRQAFAVLGIPSAVKTDNGPAYASQQVRQFLQSWGVSHNFGIPHSLTGQAIVERNHGTLKCVLQKQKRGMQGETPHSRLAKALYTINHLTVPQNSNNPLILNHHLSLQASDSEQQPRAKVRVQNLVTKQWEGPYDLIAMGRGYACVSTDTGTRWLPSKCVRPDLRPQRQNSADRQGGSRDQLESHQVDESSSDHSDDSSTDSD
ncbi:hypothetical protein DUI87_01661 [Hirundo rustica rustica]|uniref:ribonuclease H n=1 Tax=Hirundo rustica rustica TaxID=333673 RepID=A0A3M0L5N2_HIRRU|nr:hypothetical protein DUI87_01661 [Hirundo rustica rustica]